MQPVSFLVCVIISNSFMLICLWLLCSIAFVRKCSDIVKFSLQRTYMNRFWSIQCVHCKNLQKKHHKSTRFQIKESTEAHCPSDPLIAWSRPWSETWSFPPAFGLHICEESEKIRNERYKFNTCGQMQSGSSIIVCLKRSCEIVEWFTRPNDKRGESLRWHRHRP